MTNDNLPELVRYGANRAEFFDGTMEKDPRGKYVLYVQAAAVIAAKDAEINELVQKNNDAVIAYHRALNQCSIEEERAEDAEAKLAHFNGVKGVNTQYSNALANLGMTEDDDPENFASSITDKLEKLAQYEAQEPVGYVTDRVKTRDGSHCFMSLNKSAPYINAVYASPAPAADLKEMNGCGRR